MKQPKKRARMGRPPRTDKPVDIGTRLPGALWRWVRARARTEDRAINEVLTSALVLYRAHVEKGERE